MLADQAAEQTASLMTGFAERTGLSSTRPARRYLWTDAFAVCNFLGLARSTGEKRHIDLALHLVDQVHHVLGRHRPDDSRIGWISGLAESDGERHPTRGGLRIGKPRPERAPNEPFDERLEWDRDGQYFHYLTRWMHALDQVARSTRESRYNLWARELAAAAHAAFVHGPASRRGMPWKMSTDLSRPLVASTGQHDPIDGFITCIQLEATASRLPGESVGPSLERAAADFARLVEQTDLRTSDPLGLGGLLADACRLARILDPTGGRLLERLLGAALDGVARYARRSDWQQPASRRLAFRELGLAIGLAAIERIREAPRTQRRDAAEPAWRSVLGALAPYTALGPAIASFWLAPENRSGATWSEHLDINEVMLATSLLPESYLVPCPVD